MKQHDKVTDDHLKKQAFLYVVCLRQLCVNFLFAPDRVPSRPTVLNLPLWVSKFVPLCLAADSKTGRPNEVAERIDRDRYSTAVTEGNHGFSSID